MKKSIFSAFIGLLALVIGFSAMAATPPVPNNLVATPSSPTTIGLTWDASSGASGYRVFRNSTSSPIATTTINSYSDSGLAPNTSYTYYVAAYDASSSVSALTSGVSTTTWQDISAPSIPTGLTAVPASITQINLSWATSSDNVGVTGYSIYRDGAAIATSTVNSFSNMGLDASTTYEYQVKAFDAAGNYSGLSSIATATPQNDNAAPTVPQNLAGNAVSKTQINLTWTSSTDNVGVTGYKIFRNGLFVANSPANNYSNIGLSASTTYKYFVSAFDAAGNNSGTSTTIQLATLSYNPLPSTSTIVSVAIMGQDKNSKTKLINLRSNEIIKLVVYSTADFEARNIQGITAYFGGARAIFSFAKKDVNRDGRIDNILYFRARDMKDLANTDTYAIFYANTKDGKTIAAQVPVKVKNAISKKSVYKEHYMRYLHKKMQEIQAKAQAKIQSEIKKMEQKKAEILAKMNKLVKKSVK